MSRIRSIKPEWLDDELLGRASDAARMLSVALITLADDYGNARGSTAFLRSRVWGYRDDVTNQDAERAFQELVSIGFAEPYWVSGQRYFHIRNWDKHQKVSKPGKPRVPGPEEGDPGPPENPRGTSGDSRAAPEHPRDPAKTAEPPGDSVAAREPTNGASAQNYTGNLQSPEIPSNPPESPGIPPPRARAPDPDPDPDQDPDRRPTTVARVPARGPTSTAPDEGLGHDTGDRARRRTRLMARAKLGWCEATGLIAEQLGAVHDEHFAHLGALAAAEVGEDREAVAKRVVERFEAYMATRHTPTTPHPKWFAEWWVGEAAGKRGGSAKRPGLARRKPRTAMTEPGTGAGFAEYDDPREMFRD